MRHSYCTPAVVLMLLFTGLSSFAEPGAFPTSTAQEALERVEPAICVIAYTSEVTNPSSGEARRNKRSAMGIIVSEDGLVMTLGHMLTEDSEATGLRISVGQGEEEESYDATLLEKPEDVNVCFAQIEADDETFPFVTFEDVALASAEPIMVVGVLGKSFDFARAPLFRRIGAVLEKPRTTYALDEALNYGFVGGPAIDVQGRLVGVSGYDLSPDEGGDLYVRNGHPLIYQTALFQGYIDTPPTETVADDGAEDAWLGIFTQPLEDDFAEYWGLEPEGGVVVSSIVPGSPAEGAGFQRGDVVKVFDGTPVKAKQDREILGFTKLVRETGPNKDVRVHVLRDGKPMDINVTLGAKPKAAKDAEEYVDDVLGLTVRELTTDVRIMLNLPEDANGVIVRRVKSGGVAALAGMRPGVIIMRLGESTTFSVEEYREAVKAIQETKPEEIPAFCRAGSATGFFRLEPRW